jgi:hypothetical protein
MNRVFGVTLGSPGSSQSAPHPKPKFKLTR